jgi:hypothetical protein
MQDKRAWSDDSDDEIMDLTGAPPPVRSAKKAKSEDSSPRKALSPLPAHSSNENLKAAVAGVPAAPPPPVPASAAGKAVAKLAAGAGQALAALSAALSAGGAAAAPSSAALPAGAVGGAVAAAGGPPSAARPSAPTAQKADSVAQKASAEERLDEALDGDVGLQHTNTDEQTFATYRPTTFTHACFSDHPDEIFETSSMACLAPPKTTYKLAICSQTILRGLLTNAQLEAISLACAQVGHKELCHAATEC